MNDLDVLLVAPEKKGIPSGLDWLGEAIPNLNCTRTSAVHKALNHLEERKFDAIVCVVERPDELAIIVRVRKIDSKTPLLLLTDALDSEIARWGRALGATDVATKCASPEAIAERIGNPKRASDPHWEQITRLRPILGEEEPVGGSNRRGLIRP